MPHFEFKLPDIGEGVVEGEIVKWLVKAGDPIVEDQPLVEVMTDKATVTIPSPRRGQVVRSVGSEGEMGVDLAQLHGSGPQGRVMKADVLAHAEFRMPAPLAKAPAPRVEALQHDEVRPLRGLRKSIARSMVQSHAYVVPFTFVEE